MLKFPLLSQPLGKAVHDGLVEGFFAQPKNHETMRPCEELSERKNISCVVVATEMFVLLGLLLATALLFENLSTVLAVTGVTVGVVVCFVLPASFYRKVLELHGQEAGLGPLVMMLFGVAVSIAGCVALFMTA
eukprot:SAG31_NODE_2755_length_5141_cov_1.849266_3_plen_133_part_00